MREIRRCRILGAVLALCAGTAAWGQDTRYVSEGQWEQLMITAPACLTGPASAEGGFPECPPNMHSIWLRDITHWRAERKSRIGYDSARYELPSLKWTQS